MIPNKEATLNTVGIFQGVERLFVLAYDDSTNTDGNDANGRVKVDSYQKYFLSRVNIENYNIEIDGRNSCGQPIHDSIKKYDEVRETATGQGDDYTKVCLLDFDKNYKLIAADLSKQKSLHADPRTIQQIEFSGTVETKSRIYCILVL